MARRGAAGGAGGRRVRAPRRLRGLRRHARPRTGPGLRALLVARRAAPGSLLRSVRSPALGRRGSRTMSVVRRAATVGPRRAVGDLDPPRQYRVVARACAQVPGVDRAGAPDGGADRHTPLAGRRRTGTGLPRAGAADAVAAAGAGTQSGRGARPGARAALGAAGRGGTPAGAGRRQPDAVDPRGANGERYARFHRGSGGGAVAGRRARGADRRRGHHRRDPPRVRRRPRGWRRTHR